MGYLRAPPPTRKRRLISAVVLAIAGHALLLPLLARSELFQGGGSGPKKSRVSLVSTSRGQVQRLAQSQPGSHPTAGSSRSMQPLLPSEPLPMELVPKKAELVPGQVVSLGQPTDERAPDKPTKYLSEKDSRVEKETRAKETSAFHKNALSKLQKEGEQKAEKPKSAEPPPPPTPIAGKQGEQGENGGQKQASKEAARPAELPGRKRIDRLKVQTAEDGTLRNRATSDALPGEGKKLAMARPSETGSTGPVGEGAGKPGAPGQAGLLGPQKPLNLALNDIGQALGPVAGGPMNDDLHGVEEGEETLLNSRGFKYAGFLNRVKEQVGRIWVGKVQDESQRRDPTGQLYSYKDRRTVVEFVLDARGDVREVRVASSSGVDYLDRVAVDSFKQAEHFPNPPSGLMGPDGLLRQSFAFTLLVSTGPRLSFGPAYVPGSPAQRGF